MFILLHPIIFYGYNIYRYKIRPRCLRDVSVRDISTTVLGAKVSMPVGISPTAMQRMAHPEGECASARGKLNIEFN